MGPKLTRGSGDQHGPVEDERSPVGGAGTPVVGIDADDLTAADAYADMAGNAASDAMDLLADAGHLARHLSPPRTPGGRPCVSWSANCLNGLARNLPA